MTSFDDHMKEYQKQLTKGSIQVAYTGLMDYIRALRKFFKDKYPDYVVPGNIYYGYMDMTYFALVPQSLKRHKLKIAIVFHHELFRFEVWLIGLNRTIQARYWKVITESGWKKYHVVSPAKGVDAIIEDILVPDPDFSNLDTLTKQIERGTLNFITDVETFLSKK